LRTIPNEFLGCCWRRRIDDNGFCIATLFLLRRRASEGTSRCRGILDLASPDVRAADSAASALPTPRRLPQSRLRPPAPCQSSATSWVTVCAHQATELRRDSVRAVDAAPCPLL
jgi:hypothetical protein